MASLTDDEVLEACGEDPSFICDWVADRTDSVTLTKAADTFIDLPLRILLIVVVAAVVAWIGRRAVTKMVRRVAGGSVSGLTALEDRRSRRLEREEAPASTQEVSPTAEASPSTMSGPASRPPSAAVHAGRDPLVERQRLQQRIDTLAAVVGSLVTAAVWVVAVALILGLFDISLVPLLASAGVVGVALGFGAQSVVSDFLTGVFMLFEDQYGVGDIVDVGDTTGTVEKFSLRVTTLRDVDGTLWHVRNSEIAKVGNRSQLWARAVIDVDVAYDTDIRQAEAVIQRVADELWCDSAFNSGDIVDKPEVWGIEELGADGVTIRLVVKTDPADQWVVGRELRLRIKEALDAAGIEIPFPQRTVWLRTAE